MSKAKPISKTGKSAAIAKPSGSAVRNSSTSGMSTRAAALPLGFASVFGLFAFSSLCFLVLIAPYLFSGFWPSSYEYWPQGIFLALTSATCVLVALEPNLQIPKFQNSKTSIFLTLFLIWCALSIFGTVYLHDSILEFARIAGVLAWFFIARALLLNQEYFARRASWLLVFIACGAVLVCIPAIMDFVQTRNPRQFSSFYNPNLFANYCALSLPLSASGVLALWRGDDSLLSNFKRGASAAAFLIIALGLFLTSSKGGFLAALCGLTIFASAIFLAKGESVKAEFRARKKAVAIIALLVIIGGGVLFSKTIAPRLSSKMSEDNSTMFRVYTWHGTLKMASARPLLGFGIGSFSSAYTRFAQTGYTRTSHQLWLQFAAECGFPAMVLLLLACGASTLSGIRALKTENWKFAAGALGALAAFFVHGLTDAGWSISSIAVLAMIVLALLECSASTHASNLEPRTSNLNWFWLLAALPLALGSWLYQRAQIGEDLRSESRELMARGLPSTAVEKAREARDADRLSARMATNLAQTENAAPKPIPSSDNYWLYQTVIRLQPTRALNYLNYAEYSISSSKPSDEIAKLFDKAVELDPNDTEIRFSRAQWKLSRKDQSARNDLLQVIASTFRPYGMYPATPEMVDLNFARAYLLFVQNFSSAKFDRNFLITRGLEVIAQARKYELQRRAMEQAAQDHIDESRVQAMDELEAQFKSLQEKLK